VNARLNSATTASDWFRPYGRILLLDLEPNGIHRGAVSHNEIQQIASGSVAGRLQVEDIATETLVIAFSTLAK
jgi:hypothetical protein